MDSIKYLYYKKIDKNISLKHLQIQKGTLWGPHPSKNRTSDIPVVPRVVQALPGANAQLRDLEATLGAEQRHQGNLVTPPALLQHWGKWVESGKSMDVDLQKLVNFLGDFIGTDIFVYCAKKSWDFVTNIMRFGCL